MTWNDSQRRTVEAGDAARISIPGVDVPCVVLRQDVYERLLQGKVADESIDDEDGDLVDAPYEEWAAAFQAWIDSMPPAPATFDDSRDSIYGDDRVP